jgi:hypothetical protein
MGVTGNQNPRDSYLTRDEHPRVQITNNQLQ